MYIFFSYFAVCVCSLACFLSNNTILHIHFNLWHLYGCVRFSRPRLPCRCVCVARRFFFWLAPANKYAENTNFVESEVKLFEFINNQLRRISHGTASHRQVSINIFAHTHTHAARSSCSCQKRNDNGSTCYRRQQRCASRLSRGYR